MQSFFSRCIATMGEEQLVTRFAGVFLRSPLMNASGCRCTTGAELVALSQRDAVGAVLTKSMTLEARAGNAPPRYGETEHGTINANGLCNLGVDAYLQHFERDLLPYQRDVPTLFSVSAMDVKALDDMLFQIAYSGARPTLIEVNVSCPNLPDGGNGALSLQHLSNVLMVLSKYHYKKMRFGVKLPPLFSMGFTQLACDILNQYTHVLRFVTCSNSLPKGMLIDPDTDRPMLAPNQGFGGVGGVYMKPMALAEVRRVRHCLDKRIQVVGCGGVRTGRDVYDLLLVGASAVQIGSTLMQEGVGCFERIANELLTILDAKDQTIATVPKIVST